MNKTVFIPHDFVIGGNGGGCLVLLVFCLFVCLLNASWPCIISILYL